MNLSPAQARAVLAGRKTQIRVPIVEPRDIRRGNGTTYTTSPYRPTTGQRIPVTIRQMVDGEITPVEVCAIIVTGYRHQLLGDIDYAAARAEGHRTVDDYREWWVRLRERAWAGFTDQLLASMAGTEQQLAEALDIGVSYVRRRLRILAACHAAQPDDAGVWDRAESGEHLAMVDRFNHRHADTAVWAVSFRLDTSQPARYLAPVGRGDDRGYTPSPGQAIPGELEAPEDSWLKLFAAEGEQENARRRGEVEDARLAERRDLGQRLLNAKALARERGVDVNSDLRFIERKIADIEDRIRRQHPNAA